jgi:hypothetical protein
MSPDVMTIIVAVIGAAGTIGAAFVGAYIAARSQVAKGVKKISENLPSWELLFEHDHNGNRIDGAIERLIEAVGKAYPVKVKIYQAKNQFDMMDAQWIFVENNVVHASNTDQISCTKDSSGNYVFISDAYHYYVIVSSEGHHHASRVYIDGRQGNTTNSKRHMAWYGLVPPNP